MKKDILHFTIALAFIGIVITGIAASFPKVTAGFIDRFHIAVDRILDAEEAKRTPVVWK